MTRQHVVDVIEEFTRDQRWNLIRQQVEFTYRPIGDAIVVEVSDFPGIPTTGPGKRQAEITLAELHASPIVRVPGQGLRTHVIGVVEALLRTLLADRQQPQEAIT